MTRIMDYWLSITISQGVSTYIFPSTHTNWRDRGWTEACAKAFHIYRSSIFEQFQTLILPVWHQSHFFLMVAYPFDRKWEYYNTMGWRKRHFVYAGQFRSFICAEFESRGWHGLGHWEMQKAVDCPQHAMTVVSSSWPLHIIWRRAFRSNFRRQTCGSFGRRWFMTCTVIS